MVTRAIGVSFRIFALILCVVSASPETQTLVTRPFRGLLCNAGIGFGSDEVTEASTRPTLPSLNILQSFLNCSTLLACTGSLWIGVPSSVPSGKVHRRRESGLACRISWGSGPAKLDEKGTLKDRLTKVSEAVRGDMGEPFMGRLTGWTMGMSICCLDMKPFGVIFSRPWRADPVMFWNLCILSESRQPPTQQADSCAGKEEESAFDAVERGSGSCGERMTAA